MLLQEQGGPTTTAPPDAATGAAQPELTQAVERLTDEVFGRFDFLRDNPEIQAILIVVAAVVLAQVVAWLTTRVLRNIAMRTSSKLDDVIADWVRAPLVRSIVIVGLAVASRLLPLPDRAANFTENALLTLAALVWAPFVFRTTSRFLRTASQDPQHFKAVEPRTYPLFDNLAKILIFGAFVYLIIDIWEADPSGLLASAGILGIAIGFAAQDTLGNLITGVFIIADAPYRVGDYITLDSGERGQVLNIGLRSTRLLTRDDIEITVPNAIMGKAKIINEAGGPSTEHRIRIPVSVAYGSDVDVVRRVLVDVAEQEDRVAKTPEPRVRFRAFGDSGLEIELLCWIPEPWMRGQVIDALNTAVYKRFAAEGIEIPYPKRDVYVRAMPREASEAGAPG